MSDQEPHNPTAEKAVLGAVLLDEQHLLGILAEGLRPEHFFNVKHKIVFDAMLALHDLDKHIDPLTVADHLKNYGQLDDIGGYQALEEFGAWVPASGHAREYGKIVKDHAVRRRLIADSKATQEQAHQGGNLDELLADAEQRMLDLQMAGGRDQPIRINPDDEIVRLYNVKEGIQTGGLMAGFTDLDKITNGFQPGTLVIVAGRPAMGKSLVGTNIAEHVAAQNIPVLLFSLEMTRHEILKRMIASYGRIPAADMTSGPLSDKRFQKALQTIGEIVEWPLFIDETPDLSIAEARVKARRLHKQHNLGLIIVDYLQLMQADSTHHNDNRNLEVGRLTSGLRALAKELKVPVIALSQLSRQTENRNQHRPSLADLRDSGNIEQDADLVMFLYRPYYYDQQAEPSDADLTIAKHRNGRTGVVPLTFLDTYPRFDNHADPTNYSQPPSSGAPF